MRDLKAENEELRAQLAQLRADLDRAHADVDRRGKAVDRADGAARVAKARMVAAEGRVVPTLALDVLRGVVADLIAEGHGGDALAEKLADALDAAIDWRRILGPVTGGLLETMDRPILLALARAVLRELDPVHPAG